ncbi:MAG: phosphotransferase family protein [Bacteroidota bacterium]
MDIKNLSDLKNYLAEIDFLKDYQLTNYNLLPGGVSAHTVYVDGDHPIVVKQALGKLKTQVDWFSDPERIAIENLGLNWLFKNLPIGSVPKPIYFDLKNNLMIMEGIAPPVDNLKSLLLNGVPPKHLIESFGKMLGTIHRKGMEDPNSPNTFSNRDFFINLRLEPYYEFTGGQVPSSKPFYHKLIQSTLDHRITIVHGDFSPKNILVKDNHLILLDHEVMHFGDPAFDVGFALTHFLSKANHLSNISFVDLALLVWDSYRSEFSFNEDDYQSRCIRHLLGCMLARIHGKSPLEYLSREHRDWQSQFILALLNNIPGSMIALLETYKKSLNERQS